MNYLVKILSNDDGEKYDNPKWCLIMSDGGGLHTLCRGEFFGLGESNCEYKTKSTNKGGVTCPNCIDIIKTIKAVNL